MESIAITRRLQPPEYALDVLLILRTLIIFIFFYGAAGLMEDQATNELQILELSAVSGIFVTFFAMRSANRIR
ncbi:hypothetical protein BOTNAR_0265g00050 [Botryotinia narcissicola]|uniref:Uncharacterized protein n=1 Tax=Botryotinia narcissicola TaxID=278944 RepID=A0A4Z1HZ53_9HELO|nr:hypothetical protein BOTNAR_0265g00050 [Botryotinia narcissicola]